jgi:hypothetical protein
MLDSMEWSEAGVVFVNSESSCVVEFMLFFTCVSEVTLLRKSLEGVAEGAAHPSQ